MLQVRLQTQGLQIYQIRTLPTIYDFQKSSEIFG